MTRTDITRLREKASTDRAELDGCSTRRMSATSASSADDGHPVVVPTAVARDGDRVLLHGSTGSPWLRRLAAGVPTCLR